MQKIIKFVLKIFIVLFPLLFYFLVGEYQGYGPEKEASDILMLKLVFVMYAIECVFFVTGRINLKNKLLLLTIRVFSILLGLSVLWQSVNG